MSTEHFEKYEELKSRYIDLNITLHNYLVFFSRYKGPKITKMLKHTCREMREILFQMEKILPKVRREHVDNWRQVVAEQKRPSTGGFLYARKSSKLKEPNYGNDDTSTSNSI